jgi:hypothetical protein
VNNTFNVSNWEADRSESIEGVCETWCTAHLNIVPARVAGNWRLGSEDLVLTQEFQKVSGTLGTRSITGRLNGEQITLNTGEAEYQGRVTGDRIEGTATIDGKTQNWTATRQN